MPFAKRLDSFLFPFYNKSETEKYLFWDFILAQTSTASFIPTKCLKTSEKLPQRQSPAFFYYLNFQKD